jgi:hypothetical protein
MGGGVTISTSLPERYGLEPKHDASGESRVSFFSAVDTVSSSVGSASQAKVTALSRVSAA